MHEIVLIRGLICQPTYTPPFKGYDFEHFSDTDEGEASFCSFCSLKVGVVVVTLKYCILVFHPICFLKFIIIIRAC